MAENLNWGGWIGAYASYGAFAGMGWAAYVWPMLLLLWGWNRVRCQPLAHCSVPQCGVVAHGRPPQRRYRPARLFAAHGLRAGVGCWGPQLSLDLLIPYLGRMGSAVLLSALFVVAVILTPDLNWRLLAWMGAGAAVVVAGGLGVWRLPRLAVKSKAAKRGGDVGATWSEIGAEPRVEDAAPWKPMVENAVQVQEPARAERRKRKKEKEKRNPRLKDAPAPVHKQEPAEPARKPAEGSLRDSEHQLARRSVGQPQRRLQGDLAGKRQAAGGCVGQFSTWSARS